MVMAVPTWLQTQYNNTNQSGTAYPLAIDGNMQIFARAGDMFACHQRATANMTVEVDPGFIFDPLAKTLIQVGNFFTGNLHTNTTVDTLSTTSGISNGMAIRSTEVADGIPANATISSGGGTSSLTISSAATTSNTAVFLIASQLTGTITAPVSNPRIDRVVVDAGTGVVSVITGTENATPSPPALTAGKMPVAQILLQTTSTSITGSMITDERAVWMRSPGIPWTAASGTADAITATYAPTNPALYDGLILSFRATAANATTTPTFSPDGLTAHTITAYGGQLLYANAIGGAAFEAIVRYNLANTRWELLNPQPPPGVPTGATLDYHGFTAPVGFLFADGTAISRTSFPTLFNVMCLSTTGNFTASSAIVTNIPSTVGMVAGMPISGPNVPSGATIATVDSTTQIHMSANATGTLPANGAALVVCPNGAGDGSTTYNLPDYRGRFGVGRDDMNSQGTSSNPANRLTTGGSGIQGIRFGANGGSETVTLTTTTQASMSVTSVSVTVNSTTSVYSLAGSLAGPATGPCFAGGSITLTSTGTVSGQTASGGGAAHQNTPNSLVCNVIIKT